jgi:hypothetical protein
MGSPCTAIRIAGATVLLCLALAAAALQPRQLPGALVIGGAG